MKKYIVLVVTTLILTGLAGCSMTKNRYNHYGVVKYLENKYDDKFEYYETYGGTLFDSDSWKKFICTSEKYPGKQILVIYDVNHDEYHDNYFDIKYARQVDELIDSILSDVFGDDPYYFMHYESLEIDGTASQFDADTTFEEYIAEKYIHLVAYIKSDKSNEEIESRLKEQILESGMCCRGGIDIHFLENFDLDEDKMHNGSYIYELRKTEIRRYRAKMKDNRTFVESYWEN
ncbi:hypothetical protein [Roseburia inulinivorans]|uniref:hypothetical protein n=1 Tax=Roseburia inulinivorans TaxID=360807 RepID=UPI00248F5CD7|nr:hypothetical protein [Roseburia inulinivorans]